MQPSFNKTADLFFHFISSRLHPFIFHTSVAGLENMFADFHTFSDLYCNHNSPARVASVVLCEYRFLTARILGRERKKTRGGRREEERSSPHPPPPFLSSRTKPHGTVVTQASQTANVIVKKNTFELCSNTVSKTSQYKNLHPRQRPTISASVSVCLSGIA